MSSPPTPPRAPTPPPPPPVIQMNSVSTETDIERPPSPVMAKELHDRMRRSGMTQVYDPHGYPGGMPGSYSNSSSSYDRGSYNGYSSSHSSGYPQSPYVHNYHHQHPPHQQFHQDRHQQGLRPALPTSNSFELPPSRTFSSSSANGLRNNQPLSKSAKQSPVPVPLKKPQPMLPPPSPQPPQTTMRALSPPKPPSPPVSSLSLPVDAGKSTSIEGVTGIASASAGSPLPSGREAEVKIEASSKSQDINENTEVPMPVLVPVPAPTPAVAASPVKESTTSGINNCSSNSFGHWPDLPPIDTSPPKQLQPSGPDKALHRSNGSDYSILKSNMSVSPASSVRSSRNLTFSDTAYTRSETQEAEKEANLTSSSALMSPSYKDFHLKYTNGMQAVQSVKSDSFSPRADLLDAEETDPLSRARSVSTSSGALWDLGNNIRANMNMSESSTPKNIFGSQPTPSTRDKANTVASKDDNIIEKVHNEKDQVVNQESTSPARTMMDTLLLQTTFLAHRQEVHAQYKAPEHVYMKQFHSVDPRVFEVEFENNQSAGLSPKASTPTRVQYRNSIMELIVATPNFVHSPRHAPDTVDADLDKAAFNASFMNSARLQSRQLENNSDGESEYDGSVIESEEEESKSDTMSDLDVQSVRTLQSVHTVQTTESSVLGVHPAQVNGCMIHKLLGTHSEHNMPVEFGSRKSAKVTTSKEEPAKDGARNFSAAISIKNLDNEEKAPLGNSEKEYDYVSVDDDSLISTPVVETPQRAEKSPRSRKAGMSAANVNNASVMSLPNPSMLQHTSSTRSVHRSFKYDEGIKKHILGRQTTSIKGQNKLHETALEFKQEACLNSIDAKNLKLASVTNRNVLVGWQILILKKGELSLLGKPASYPCYTFVPYITFIDTPAFALASQLLNFVHLFWLFRSGGYHRRADKSVDAN